MARRQRDRHYSVWRRGTIQLSQSPLGIPTRHKEGQGTAHLEIFQVRLQNLLQTSDWLFRNPHITTSNKKQMTEITVLGCSKNEGSLRMTNTLSRVHFNTTCHPRLTMSQEMPRLRRGLNSNQEGKIHVGGKTKVNQFGGSKQKWLEFTISQHNRLYRVSSQDNVKPPHCTDEEIQAFPISFPISHSN